MKDVVERIQASGSSASKAQIKLILSLFQDILREDVIAGHSVSLRGLCTFNVVDEPEKTRKSFGKEITTPARREVKVKVSHQLKESVRAS